MDKRDFIGVVTVTFNSGSVIQSFMDSLLRQSHANFRLYAVDNASSDSTLELLAQYRDTRVVILGNQENVGVAEGNNIGIRAALKDGCASVLLINNDTVFDSDLISKLCDALREHKCEMTVPKILFFDEPEKIWCAGGAFSHWRGTARHFGFCQKDDGRFDGARAVDYSPTCCMLVRREVFERIGLMDANYFVYFDDTDFCLRAHRAGIRLFYVPTIRLLHKVSSLIGRRSDVALRYVSRNHVYHVLKNYQRWMAVYYLPLCQVYVLGRSFFAKEKVKAFFLAEKAFWEGLSLFDSYPDSTKSVSGTAEEVPKRTYSAKSDLAKEARWQ